MMRTFGVGAALALAMIAPGAFAQPVAVTIDAGKSGATIDRDIFGQFAEHLGTGIYGGVWVGPVTKAATSAQAIAPTENSASTLSAGT